MERYRNFVRLEQMKENIRAGRNEEALKLADCLNPAAVRSNSDLSIMSDLYLESGMLAKAGACLDELYSRKKTRSILMQLINLSVRLKKVEEAEKYYREFKAMAPDDFYNYIFRYSIDKIKGRNYDTLIEHLEKLKATEYIDSWAYELAKLYHKAGRKDDCIRECDDIVIWFGDGEYVDRAKALKAYYLGELSGVMRSEKAEQAEPAEEHEAAADPEESQASQEGDDSGIVEIIGSVEEATAAALPDEESDDDMVIVPGKETEEDTEPVEEGSEEEDEFEDEDESGDMEEPDVPDETEIAEVAAGTAETNVVMTETESAPETPETAEGTTAEAAAETEEEDSDYAEDLKDFEADIDDIKIADEVFAQIEGYEGSYIEVEPVDVSGVINDEDFEDADKAPAGSVSVKYEPEEEEETEEEMQLEEDEEDTSEETEDVIEDEDVPEAEADTEEEIETVSHTFKGPGSSKIAPDSLLAAFLAKKDAQLEDYFGFFAYQRDIRGQLIKVLEILLNPQIKNKCLIVSGEHNSGSKTIIKGITKILYQNGFLKSPQVAFTEAEKMNTMSLEDKMERLLGCCVLINNAGMLSADAVGRLLKANEKFAGRTAVIITDHRSEINRMLKDYREINSMFPQRVHIPSYDMEDMEDLLFVRLNENSCEIEKHAYQLMMKKLKSIVKEVHEGSLAEADRFIGGAIDEMETRNAKKLLAGGFGQVKSNDRIVTAADVEE